jgi:hypothetical protein
VPFSLFSLAWTRGALSLNSTLPINYLTLPNGIYDRKLIALVFPKQRSRSGFHAESHTIPGMFMAIFEGELGDAGFIELSQAFGDHAVVLFLGRERQR